MYQPYPGSAELPAARRPPLPASVHLAVRLMYAGAVASVLNAGVDVATVSATRRAIVKLAGPAGAGAPGRLSHALVGGFVADGLIGVALWLLIAWGCRNGMAWGRILGTIVCVIATVDLVVILATGLLSVPARLGWAVVWLLGLIVIVLLWRRDSSAFFRAASS